MLNKIPRGLPLHLAAMTLLLTVASAPAHGLSVVSRSFDELVSLAELVLVGTVTTSRSAYDPPEGQHIYTYFTLDNLEVVKGAWAQSQYTLRVAGGQVGDMAQVYSGLPELRLGERYVLFVRANNRDLFPVVGIDQGVYRVEIDAAGREVVIQSRNENKPASSLTPQQTLRDLIRRIRTKLGEPAP